MWTSLVLDSGYGHWILILSEIPEVCWFPHGDAGDNFPPCAGDNSKFVRPETRLYTCHSWVCPRCSVSGPRTSACRRRWGGASWAAGTAFPPSCAASCPWWSPRVMTDSSRLSHSQHSDHDPDRALANVSAGVRQWSPHIGQCPLQCPIHGPQPTVAYFWQLGIFSVRA